MQSKTQSHPLNLRKPAVNNGLFAILSLAGSALSYLLYPVLAKLIAPASFGDVSVVIALAGQLGGLLLAFNVVSIYIVDTHEQEHALRITETIQKIVIQVLLVATVVVTLMSPWLKQILHISSMWTILGLGLFLLSAVPVVVWTGFLQGHKEMARIGIYNAVVALAKLIGGAGLAAVGLGAPGAVVGILLGQLVGLWVIRKVPGAQLPSAAGSLSRITPAERETMRPLAGYVAESLTVVSVFSVLFAIDIILAKSLFAPYWAGLYAGVAALGRIIFFGANILTWIMLANLTHRDLAKSRVTLARNLGLIAGLGLLGVAGFWLASGLIVRQSLGASYQALAPQLWLTGLNQLIASLLYAYTLYLLVLRKSRPALLALLSCGLAVVGGVVLHGSPHQMLLGLIGGQVAGYGAYAVLASGRKLIGRSAWPITGGP